LETIERYLVDTNVWLELLLDQEKANVSSEFFDLIPTSQLYISDFTIHSMGVILSRFKKYDILKKVLIDLFVDGHIEQVSLESTDLLTVIDNIQSLKLDFDDSYQFTVASKYNLIIVTFDKDFNAKGIRKKLPEEIINSK